MKGCMFMDNGKGGFYIPGQGSRGTNYSSAAAGYPVDELPEWEIDIAGVLLLPCKAATCDITSPMETPTKRLNESKLGDMYIEVCARLAYEIGNKHIFAVPRNVLAKDWLKFGHEGSRLASPESEWQYLLEGLNEKGVTTKELMMIAHRNCLGVKYNPTCRISDPEPMMVFFKSEQAWEHFVDMYL